jgi:hypothetical protein
LPRSRLLTVAGAINFAVLHCFATAKQKRQSDPSETIRGASTTIHIEDVAKLVETCWAGGLIKNLI